MKQKAVYVIAAVAVVVCIVLAGRAMVSAGKLRDEVSEANAEILKLQTAQKGTSSNDTDSLQKTVDEQKEIITGLQEDNQALMQLIALQIGYSEEDLEGMTLHEILQQLMDGGYLADVHEIWDDTEVVNAYLTGDDSKVTTEQDQYVLERVRELIPQIITDKDMTDYEKEKAVYDWQVKYVNFDEDSLAPIPDYDEDEDVSYLPYGVLKYHEAICVGNATTFKLFMDCLEIPCMIIHSTQEGEHAWNLVQLDGDWYHVDITFDSIAGGEPMYTWFNVTDSAKEDAGYPWDHEEFPAADATKYNYAYMNAKELEDITEAPQMLMDRMKDGSGMLYLLCAAEEADYIYQIVDTVNSHLIDAYMDTANVSYDDEGNALVSITYEEWESADPEEPLDPDVETDTELYEKINEAMQQVFGYGLGGSSYDDADETFTDLLGGSR